MDKINGYIGGFIGLLLSVCFSLAHFSIAKYSGNGIFGHEVINTLEYIVLTLVGFVAGKCIHRSYGLSMTDPLTQVYNRSFFFNESKKYLALSKNNGRPLSVGIIDIDFFKIYNDTNGHLEGDKLLCSLARIIKKHLNIPNASVARYGGDEFLFLMPECSSVEASALMGRISEACKPLGISFSAGIATFPSDGESIDQLLTYADEILYEVKSNRTYTAQRRLTGNAYDGLIAT